ncbi:MAG: hypothetical protein LRY27_03710, partial [Chitinophagales bacterium]|nr:hypothetical protein [Chitinophagales bacterium]
LSYLSCYCSNFFKENGWIEKTNQCKKTLLKWYPKFCALLNTEAISPLHTDFLGQMCSIPIKPKNAFELKNVLYNRFKIEIPITQLGEKYFLRISYQPYNTENDLHYLYESLTQLIKENYIEI